MPADPTPPTVAPWGRDRAEALADLLERSLPGEGFTAEELESVLWDDPGVVLGTTDPAGPVAAGGATVRRFGDTVVGYVKLVVVDPDHRRAGLGRAVLSALEAWCRAEGATEVHLAGTAPVYLWPGIDVAAMTPALCLAEALGYEPRTCEFNMVLPSTVRVPTPPGVALRRILDDADDDAMRALVTRHWPWWLDEYDRALESGTAIGAFVDPPPGAGPEPLGFVCHSVSHLGLLGPMGTDPDRQGGGVGGALVAEVAKDMMAAGVSEVEVCWVGPVAFYAKLGATVHRVFRTYRKRFPSSEGAR